MHLEVRAISVTESIVLPNQPSVGQLNRIPMGGDGQTAPNAAYALQAFELVGDAGGGKVGHVITMDNRFCSLVSWVQLANVQTTPGDVDFRFAMAGTGTNEVPLLAEGGLAVAIAAAVSTSSINELWRPPPVVLPGGPNVGFVSVDMLNVLSDVVRVSMMIYLFDIDVRTKTPMGPLLWARGAR